MLKLNGITKDYEIGKTERFHALKDINLEFRKSEFVAILGPSGSGKTTLLNLIGGLDRYTSGDLIIQGVSTKKYKDRDWDTYRNHSVGFVFQSYNLIMHQSVYSNVELALTLAGVDRKERDARVNSALEIVGLKGMEHKKPNQLSGGQMQRVAIARAIINDPEILLADEPTGALDTQNSIQIMEILKDISSDRLVIMVTHNPELAEKYASRIIKFEDGCLIGDSMPLTEEESLKDSEIKPLEPSAWQRFCQNVVTIFTTKKLPKKKVKPIVAENAEITADNASVTDNAEWEPIEEDSKGKKKHSSMSYASAIKLSAKNLVTKKVRTTATAIAGSIGIIGIALVLAISSGVNGYLQSMEEDSLSTYPLTISKTNKSDSSSGGYLSSIMDMLSSKSDNPEMDSYPGGDSVYVKEVISGLFGKLLAGGTQQNLDDNDLLSLKNYFTDNFQSDWGTITYDYGTKFSVYRNFEDDPSTPDKDEEHAALLSPFTEVIDTIGVTLPDTIKNYAGMIEVWSEIFNQNLLQQQYDLIGNSHWPTSYDEIVVVVDEYNRLDDYSLFCLGLLPADQASALLANEGLNFSEMSYTVDDILNLNYYAFPNSSRYVENEGTYSFDSTFNANVNGEQLETLLADGKAVKVKVAGVIRAKEDTTATCISTVVGYTHALMEKMWEIAGTSPVAQQVKNHGMTNVVPDKSYADVDEFLVSLGSANENDIQNISIFASSFENKQKIIALLDKYNSTQTNAIKYSDSMAVLMDYATSLTDIITRVLVGFAAISLIVSSIMIAIITYTSVLERNKEIGVLRSLGASKKDVAHVFLAEAGLIGLCSGIVGILLTLVFSSITSAILQAVLGFPIRVWIEWYFAIILVFLSFILSLIAGWVPSRIAAKKDPVKALRSD